MAECEHNFQFQGVVYSNGYQIRGSGACSRIYEDRYFCTKCLEIRDLHPRTHGNNYSHPIEGTTPK